MALLDAFGPVFDLCGDGFGTGHAGGFAGGEGRGRVKDLSPVCFKGGVDF